MDCAGSSESISHLNLNPRPINVPLASVLNLVNPAPILQLLLDIVALDDAVTVKVATVISEQDLPNPIFYLSIS